MGITRMPTFREPGLLLMKREGEWFDAPLDRDSEGEFPSQGIQANYGPALFASDDLSAD